MTNITMRRRFTTVKCEVREHQHIRIRPSIDHCPCRTCKPFLKPYVIKLPNVLFNDFIQFGHRQNIEALDLAVLVGLSG